MKVKNKRSSDMDRDTQVEVVNICIVNALRIDEEHRMMILEKLTQNLTDENRTKLLRLLDVVGRSEQLKAFVKWRNIKDSNWLRQIDEKDVDDYLKACEALSAYHK
jgi:DNA polymerase IIIc chi subunit